MQAIGRRGHSSEQVFIVAQLHKAGGRNVKAHSALSGVQRNGAALTPGQNALQLPAAGLVRPDEPRSHLLALELIVMLLPGQPAAFSNWLL